jgi:hypothetical protein
MRRIVWLMLAAGLTLGNAGCLLNQWSSDPTRRINQLYNVSENERICEDAWERWWQIDQPSHLTPVRVHGGIGP